MGNHNTSFYGLQEHLKHLDVPRLADSTTPINLLFLNSLFLCLSGIQCALLHPRYQHSSSARMLRGGLGPLNITWWILSPYKYPASPIAVNAFQNFTRAMLGIIMIFKTVDWTFSTGPFYMRAFKYVEGVPQWERELSPKLCNENDGVLSVVGWTLNNFLSLRGFEFSWGIAGGLGNTLKPQQKLRKIVLLALIVLPCLGFAYHTYHTPSRSPTDALTSLGVPPFLGIDLFARCLHSLCHGLTICLMQELSMTTISLATHFVHPLTQLMGLPGAVCDFFDPVRYPPVVNSLLNLSSVAYFWGKSWHQLFRRGWLVCGGKPAVWLLSSMGASSKTQKLFGALGVFAVSGIVHEYMFHVISHKPLKKPDALPGSFMFFFIQSFAVIVEPSVIPLIPKWLGGGRLWTLSFLFATAPMLTESIAGRGGYVDVISSTFVM